MLNRKSIKVLVAVLVAVMMLMVVGSSVFAALPTELGSDSNLQGFEAEGKASELATTILRALRWGGSFIAVGMLIYMGIKYMTAAPDGKADLKKQLTIYIIGAVFLFAAVAIVTMIEKAING